MSDEAQTETALEHLVWSVAKLAGFLALDERRIQQLAASGVMVRTSRGQYDALASIQGYVRMLRDGSDDVSDAKERLVLEQVRWTAARADGEQEKLAILKGSAVLMKDACELLAEEASQYRTAVEAAIPVATEEIAGQVLTHAEVNVILRNAMKPAFAGLTLDTAQARKPRTREIPSFFDEEDDDELEPASE